MSLHPALSKWLLQLTQLSRRKKSEEDKNLCKEMKPVNPKGNKSWISTGGTDAEAEPPILWPPDAKNWLIGKDPDAEKDWRQEEKEMTKDEMVGWHHWLNGHEFEQPPGDGEGQGKPEMQQSMGSQRVRQLSNWKTTTKLSIYCYYFYLREVQFRYCLLAFLSWQMRFTYTLSSPFDIITPHFLVIVAISKWCSLLSQVICCPFLSS